MKKEGDLKTELKKLKHFAEILIEKDLLKKINKIEDLEERKLLYQYSIKAKLEMRYAELKDTLHRLDSKNKDVFVAMTKLYLLGSKIRLFNATCEGDDFKNIESLFKEIKKEIKNV
ncbi:MAG TPA: hypothetical protein VJH92_04205 [Candidatus Nanoarchaeia archaeon]|nr:hypothetical protein [Candidatus Nanoarchaeia archaeon]